LGSFGECLGAAHINATIFGQWISCGIAHDMGARGKMNDGVNAFHCHTPIRDFTGLSDDTVIPMGQCSAGQTQCTSDSYAAFDQHLAYNAADKSTSSGD